MRAYFWRGGRGRGVLRASSCVAGGCGAARMGGCGGLGEVLARCGMMCWQLPAFLVGLLGGSPAGVFLGGASGCRVCCVWFVLCVGLGSRGVTESFCSMVCV